MKSGSKARTKVSDSDMNAGRTTRCSGVCLGNHIAGRAVFASVVGQLRDHVVDNGAKVPGCPCLAKRFLQMVRRRFHLNFPRYLCDW